MNDKERLEQIQGMSDKERLEEIYQILLGLRRGRRGEYTYTDTGVTSEADRDNIDDMIEEIKKIVYA